MEVQRQRRRRNRRWGLGWNWSWSWSWVSMLLLVVLLGGAAAVVSGTGTGSSSPLGIPESGSGCDPMPAITYPEGAVSLGRTYDKDLGLATRDRGPVKTLQELGMRIEKWCVRPVTIWYLDEMDCPVYAGWGSAVALRNLGWDYELWVTVHHVAYPMEYESSYVREHYRFDKISIDGYDGVIVWTNGEIVLFITPHVPGTIPWEELQGWGVSREDLEPYADEVWIGEEGIGIGWTVHANFKGPHQYENLYHVPMVMEGEVYSVADYKGLLGSDFMADLNGIGGMSGGGFFIYEPDDDSRLAYADLKLAGVTNIGAVSGPLGFYMLPKDVLDQFQDWWERRQEIEHGAGIGIGIGIGTETQTDSSQLGAHSFGHGYGRCGPDPSSSLWGPGMQGFFLPVFRYLGDK